MEKTLTIDGREVRFKSTAATPLRYKAQFGKDYFSEILKMESLANVKQGKVSSKDIQKIDFEIFYNIIWVLAKTADRNIKEPMEWLDGFDEFPLMEIIPELQDLIIASLQTKKK
ncbi:hypothetical protein [Veillonella sp.]|jgi:hypothetical protein|uniref:hypothetical protein n=1 Tax=Veillonella sp. TaxID=1926307 RepID=UPI0020551376|nr:hypothetical protein [Veillonella sp.]MBS6486369.1 hypothetical protein [Veillonella sp.]DAL52990.1 MAG TPA_asm: tail assembly chaperone protein [Caudoviricetes sp.]